MATPAPTQIVETGEWTTIGRPDCQRVARPVTLTTGHRVREMFEGRQSGLLYDACGVCTNGTREEYLNIHGGVCFYCRGTAVVGSFDGGIDVARKREMANWRADRTRERKAAEKAAADAAELVAWAAANVGLARGLAAIVEATQGGAGSVGMDLYELAYKAQRAPLSPKQAAYAQRLLDEEHERAAYIASCRYAGEIGQTVTVTGQVSVASKVDGYYGAQMLVIVEGRDADEGVIAKVYSTAKAAWTAERGDEMTVTGVVKRHGEYNEVPQTELGGRCTFKTTAKAMAAR
jgi:hypothetical protein